MSDIHDDSRRGGQGIAHVLEQGFKLRHHKAQHGHDRQHRHTQQDGRVNGGRYNAFSKCTQPVQVLHQALQHSAQLAAGLTRADHVDIKVAKLRGVSGQGSAYRRAAFDVVEDGLREADHGRFGVHADQHAQGVVKGQACLQHDGEFARHHQNVCLRNGLGFDPLV